VLPTSKTLVYVCFLFVCLRKEVKRRDAEEKIKSTGKKEYSETQMEGNSKV